MCGFAGFWDPRSGCSPEELAAIAEGMSDCLLHRGPDAGGHWIDPEVGLGFGHRRLAIVDLSADGAQPMVSRDERYVISFNGEIYNFKALSGELRAKGYSFRGHSDTEVLLNAVAEWGIKSTLERAVGMFAFAIWDREERRLHLCRDRIGEKPLYYGWMGQTLLFGSELKALRRHPAWRGEIDRESLTLYMRYNYVPAPRSIYQGVRKLPPGTYLTLDGSERDRDAEPTEYWSVAGAVEAGERDPFGGSPEEAVGELDRVLREAIALQMVADVPVGAFLSGGVDSSTVVALMQAQSSRPVHTFTIGFGEKAYNEAEYARAVAQHLGTEHTELYVGPRETLGVVPRLPTIYDEPFADSSQIPTFLVSELARRAVTVSLSGDGGDELFAGYNRHFLGPKIWKSVGWAPHSARRLAAAAIGHVPMGAWSSAGALLPKRQRVSHLGDKVRKASELMASKGPPEIYRALVSNWREPATVVSGGAMRVTERAPWSRGRSFSEQMMYMDSVTYLPDDILAKVDRAAMAVSLETRVPMLDHRVVELAWRIPLEMKVRNGRGKWVLREVLDRYVPRHLIDRPKMGFGAPVSVWLRGPLRDWAESLLDERRLRDEGYLNAGPIREKWLEHQRGERDWQFPLWCVLMFQAWLESVRAEDSSNRSRRAAGL